MEAAQPTVAPADVLHLAAHRRHTRLARLDTEPPPSKCKPHALVEVDVQSSETDASFLASTERRFLVYLIVILPENTRCLFVITRGKVYSSGDERNTQPTYLNVCFHCDFGSPRTLMGME